MKQSERRAGFPFPTTVQIPGKERGGQGHGFWGWKGWSSNPDCTVWLRATLGLFNLLETQALHL